MGSEETRRKRLCLAHYYFCCIRFSQSAALTSCTLYQMCAEHARILVSYVDGVARAATFHGTIIFHGVSCSVCTDDDDEFIKIS